MSAADRSLPADDLRPILTHLVPTDRAARTPEDQRAEYAEFLDMLRGPEPAFAGTITDELIEAGQDGHAVPVRRYRPDNEAVPGHVLVYFHGGGWVLGNPQTHDRFTRAIADRLRLHVISVDYRLAPEHPFPAGFDDCATVVDHAAQGASWLAVGGDSAGGNLAAAVAAHCATEGPAVDAQILVYPGLDVPTDDRDSSTDGLGLDRSDIDYFWASYRGDREPDARMAPMLGPDPIVAPPTLITTAGCDPLRPDGVRYARRLIAADVPTTYVSFPHLIHGWLDLADAVASAGRAREILIDAIGVLRDSTSSDNQLAGQR